MSGHGDETIKCGKRLEEQEGTWVGFDPEQCSEDPEIPPPGCGSIALQHVPAGKDLPDRWKRQKLLLLSKPGKPAGEASSYRPICLLDTLGKVFERVIATSCKLSGGPRAGLTQIRSGTDIKQESCGVGAYPDRRDNDFISACPGVMLDTRLSYREHLEHVKKRKARPQDHPAGSCCAPGD